jgi:hypothetical protein
VLWLLGIAGFGVWVAYLACGLLIAKVCAAGPNCKRRYFKGVRGPV